MPNNDYEDDDEYEEKKSFAPRKQNRAAAQEDVDSVVKDLHLTRDERQKLHRALGQDYLGYHEILARAKALFADSRYHISYKDGEEPRW